MIWNDLPHGSHVRLLEDLYTMQEVHSDLHYQLLTKAEVDAIISVSYKAGIVLKFNLDMEYIQSEDGELGIDINGEIDEELYLVVDS